MLARHRVLDRVEQRRGQLLSGDRFAVLPALNRFEQLRRVVECRRQQLFADAHQEADHVPAVDVALALPVGHVVAHGPEAFDDHV